MLTKTLSTPKQVIELLISVVERPPAVLIDKPFVTDIDDCPACSYGVAALMISFGAKYNQDRSVRALSAGISWYHCMWFEMAIGELARGNIFSYNDAAEPAMLPYMKYKSLPHIEDYNLELYKQYANEL